MEVTIKLSDYLTDEDIREELKAGLRFYAEKIAINYLLATRDNENVYHEIFTKTVIDYIVENYKDELNKNVECALKFAHLSFEKTTWDGKNNNFVELINKAIEKHPDKVAESFAKRIENMTNDEFGERIADAFFSAVYSLRNK